MGFPVVRLCVAALVIIGIAAAKLSEAGSDAPERPALQQPAPAEQNKTVWGGVYSEEQAKRGQSVYLDECARCHAESLTGGDFGPALIGDEFLGAWSGKTAADLFERIRQTMPQDSPGILTRQQYIDVMAYLFQENHFPAGQTALKPDLEGLRLIKVDREKPKPELGSRAIARDPAQLGPAGRDHRDVRHPAAPPDARHR